MRHSRRPHSIRVLTAGTFILLTLLVGGAIGLMAYLQQRTQWLEAVSATLERAAHPPVANFGAVREDMRATAQRRLAEIADLLWWSHDPHPTQLAILDDAGRVLAASHGRPSVSRQATLDSIGLPVLATVAAGNPEGHSRIADIGGKRWLTFRQTFELTPGQRAQTVVAVPWEAIFAGVYRSLGWTLLTCLGLAVPAIWFVATHLTRSLARLADTAAEIRRFRLDDDPIPPSPIREVDSLGKTLGQLRTSLRHFLEISQRLAGERHCDRLLNRIVSETLGAARAQAGVVFLREADGQLRPMAWRHVSHPAPVAPENIDPAIEPLFADTLERGTPRQMALASLHLPLGLEWLAGWFPGHAMEVLLVPLGKRSGMPLGLLLLARDHAQGPYDEALIAFIDALSGTMAVAIETQQLLDARKALFDGTVRMIASAIDARSPYTGAHCQRVPLLATLLAEAAAHHPDSPFRDAGWDEAARESLHLAAWLHDCGKLFVPDFVVDKAAKLETVNNRIHEIRMRFEVLKRDAEIAHWRALTGGGDASLLQARLHEELATLDDDFAFVAACNLGERELSDADIERIKRIASRTWLRTLDDRLGIGAEELLRKAAVPPRALPTPEHLLADRLEHLIDVPATHGTSSAANLARPRHRLNLGELYALCVRHGTLTPEERYLINAHILGTIDMLATLPFPAELASVPDTAGSHHEHLDGSGYPFGKRADELSLPARILAIADIYEALTAGDRPYKPGKSSAEALAILAEMARAGHIDASLLDLFVRADIPARYAERASGQSRPSA